MEDSEMVAVQDLPGDSDANKPSDATVKEQEETADVSEDQEPNENRQASVADDDITVSSATDVPMTDTPALPDDGKTATDENINRRVVEEKTDGDGGSCVQNQPQTATPSTQRRCSTPRTKLYSAAKSKNVWTDIKMGETDVAGTLEEQAAFMKDLEIFYKQNIMDFKPPKFYGEPLNCLKLWRSVIKLGGYEVVTANKLWRQVGESFHPPKTCTTVSWTFRIFFEKTTGCQATGSGRTRRDAAARAMQGWHAQRHLGHGEVSEPFVKVKSLNFSRREKPLKSFGTISRMKIFPIGRFIHFYLIWFVESGFHKQKTDERPVNAETDKEVDTEIIDIGPPADWVKINVWESKDCYEIYALVPGLLREEVRVQSDPVGRLVITGQPEQLDNPWGITPFKKVVSLPSRIDPLQTSAVVSLHGQLHVRVPFENRSA
ncbi:PREDICTED: AT-rich interactive domain-containing protein 6 isoform X6 [Populus euphratica]|uniref:AT-rich interactive domain-containing protein 6 isoform X6 n=1 Tax=Populus euphratica TaxID=75702 RepID=A0AAJ6V3J7_POPEU|nr:PREDICTED: AT-rich interactive domain-containing protein 6 isoform X6 [Populus euphratica]